MKSWPSQRRTHDPEQMWKWIFEFLSKFQGCGIKIDSLNSIRVDI